MKKSMLVAAIVACLLPQTLLAAVTSSVNGTVLTVTSDDADNIVITCDTLQVKVNGNNPISPITPTLCASLTGIVVTGGPGANTIDLNAVEAPDFTPLLTVTVDGGGDVDSINGSSFSDTLKGGDGSDSITGNPGNDTMIGDADNDTMIWNPGDGSDVADGSDGLDTMVVNGGGVSETFTITPSATGALFQRVTPNPFSVDIISTTELLELNAGGGADIVTGTTGLSGVLTMTLSGGDGPDHITGGDSFDTLNGDGGDDTLVGARGDDSMNGGLDNDILVWNPGDGSDEAGGGDGNDTMVVNGGGVSETFTITPAVFGTLFQRVTPNPFFVEINSTTENLELNANGGADLVTGTLGLAGVITMTLNGGDGPDRITGGDGPDTLNGDGGDDTLVGARGNDAMNGGDDNDTLVWNPGDGTDVASGEGGSDTMVVNGGGVSETFTITPSLTGVFFERVDPNPFAVDIISPTEFLLLNGNGGADIVTGTNGLRGVITMTVNGGDGNDHIKGGDGADTLNGEGDDDIVVGFRGNDTMTGGPGNDTLIWNNGDGSDLMDGGEGDDTVVVNGGAISETFAITPAATAAAAGLHMPTVGSVRFDRVTPAPFSLDIEAEQVDVNGNDGDDTFNVAPLANTGVHYNGGGEATVDRLSVDAQGRPFTQTASAITVQGTQPVTYEGTEAAQVINQPPPVDVDLEIFLPEISNHWPAR